MKFSSTILAAVSLLSAAVNAVPLAKRDDSTPLPSNDPFYDVPDGFEDAELGHVFKSRESPNPPSFIGLQQNTEKSIQIMYRTSNSSGAPEATVATIYVPYNGDPSKLVAYSVAEDSSFENCPPSYALQTKVDLGNTLNQDLEMAFIDIALNQGWYVVSADYEGPQSAFTAGYQAGHAVLDAIRAVLHNQNVTGVNPDAAVTMWGYSGGSLASAWAAGLQPDYYKDLNLVGVAIGGLTPNITAVTLYNNKDLGTALTPLGIVGLSNEYPEFAAEIDKELKPEMKDQFYKNQGSCALANIAGFVGQDWTSYFKDGEDTLRNPVIEKVLNENTQGKLTPKGPIYAYQGYNDEVAPWTEANKWVQLMCDRGIDIEFNTDWFSEHISQAALGAPGAVQWLIDRYDGKEVDKGCQRHYHVTNFLTISTLGILPKTFIDLIRDWLGGKVGHNT